MTAETTAPADQTPVKLPDPPTGCLTLDDSNYRSNLIDRALRAKAARAREANAKARQS